MKMNKRMTIQEAILTVVNLNQGIAFVNLEINVMGLILPTQVSSDGFKVILDSLVSLREVEQLEYILPQMEYSVKSMYFPKGTIFHNSNNSSS